ncbi:hypothetical protein ACLOJK_003745 [Asimina triloba]
MVGPRNVREVERGEKMDGDWVVRKPSRSDEVLEAEQQVQVANQIRAYFESTAPKRPKKPSRSEGLQRPSDDAAAADGDDDPIAAPEIIPEYNRFRELQSQSRVSASHTVQSRLGSSSWSGFESRMKDFIRFWGLVLIA